MEHSSCLTIGKKIPGTRDVPRPEPLPLSSLPMLSPSLSGVRVVICAGVGGPGYGGHRCRCVVWQYQVIVYLC
jgi:hypothetical protein